MKLTRNVMQNAIKIKDLSLTRSEDNSIIIPPTRGTPLFRDLAGDVSRVRFRVLEIERLLEPYVPNEIVSIIMFYWSDPIVIHVANDIVFQTIHVSQWSNLIPLYHTYFNHWYFTLSDTEEYYMIVEYQNHLISDKNKNHVQAVILKGDEHIAWDGFIYHLIH